MSIEQNMEPMWRHLCHPTGKGVRIRSTNEHQPSWHQGVKKLSYCIIRSIQMLDDIVTNDKFKAAFRECVGLNISQYLGGGIFVSLQLALINVDHSYISAAQNSRWQP